MPPNPYPKHTGFGRRLAYARNALERYGDYLPSTYGSRAFDNCFEMYDGDAVVWALMSEAIGNSARGDDRLERGIRRGGDAVWPHWMQVYSRQPAPDPGGLFGELAA